MNLVGNVQIYVLSRISLNKSHLFDVKCALRKECLGEQSVKHRIGINNKLSGGCSNLCTVPNAIEKVELI